jgi:hypothetical protein
LKRRIELALRLKFGLDGLVLMPEIRSIENSEDPISTTPDPGI